MLTLSHEQLLILALDQAESAGWSVVRPEPGQLLAPRHVLSFGVAKGFEARRNVMVLLAQHLAPTHSEPPADIRTLIATRLYVVFEDHSKVLARLGRNTKTVLGIGRARGHWEEHLRFFGVPESRWSHVAPDVWRPAVLGLKPSTPGDEAKRAARFHMAACTGRPFDRVHPDEAEAYCIGLWAGTNIPLRLAHARLVAEAERARESNVARRTQRELGRAVQRSMDRRPRR